MAKEHLNYDQLKLTHSQIGSLTSHKETRKLLGHLVDNSPARVIAQSGNTHIKLFFENDGLVAISGSPSDSRAVENNDKQIRRSLAASGIEYKTMSQYERHSKKEKKEQELNK